MIRDFKDDGLDLSKEKREQLKKVDDEITDL